MKQKRKIYSKFTAVFLVIITLFSMFPVMSVDAAGGQTTITLKRGDEYFYSSNATRTMIEMTADGKQVYCVQPDLDAPPNGVYRTDKGNLKEITSSDSKYEMYRKALYYCYGGDGFNKTNNAFKTDTSKHQLTYTGNTPSAFMGNLKCSQYGLEYTTLSGSRLHYMYTHLLMSYIYYGESTYKSRLVAWIPNSGYAEQVKELYNAVKAAPMPPISTKLYMLDIGSKYQKVIVVRNSIRLQLQKSTNNTLAKYTSLAGAQYNIFLDKNDPKNSYFGFITTDEDGYGRYGNGPIVNGVNQGAEVPTQTYYCQEVIPPKGFARDDTIYEFKVTNTTVDKAVVYRVNSKDNPYVKLQLMKSSANPDITNENSCYSLEGAKYNIYKGTSFETSSLFSYITTDSDGYGKYGKGSETVRNTDVKDKGTVAYDKISGNNVELGYDIKFYAKEVEAPPGYKLDETVYEFKDCGSISSDGVRIFRAVNTAGKQPSDKAINDPVGIILQKKNAITGETTNQGLGGAVFQIQYYSTVIDKNYDVSSGETAPALDSETLKRTWYIRTDDKGFTRLSENFLVDNEIYSSDEFYYFNNLVSVPIGTIVIKEVEAPLGYALSDIIFYRQISEEKALIAEDTNTPLEVPIDEMPANGYIGIHKMNKSGQGVKGAVYGLYTDEKATVLVSQLTTDTDGKGTFNFAAKVNQTYYIKEISAPPNYALDTTVYPVTPTIENATVDTAVVQDIYEDSVKGNIVIKKTSNDGVVSNLYFALSDNLGNTYNAVATDSTGTAKYTGLPVYDSSNNKIKYTVKELGFKTTPGTKSYGGFTWTVKAENCISYKGAYYEGVANNTFSDCEYAYSRYYYGNKTEAINNSNGYTKMLTANSSVTYSFNNTVKTTDIEISKQSYDGRKYGFWFKVVDQSEKNYGEIFTNDNGIAKYSEQYAKPLYSCITVPNSGIALRLKYRVEELGFKNPGNGSYYLPDNYINNVVTDYKSDNLSTSAAITFDAYNEPDTGRINIVKSSDDGYIANLWFKVSAYEDDTEYTGEIYDEYIGYDTSGDAIHEFYLKTDSNGRASSDSLVFYDSNGIQMSGLPVYVYGMNDTEITYKITELGLKASDGTYYLPDRYVQNDDVSFNLLDNRSYTYTCHNSVKTGKLQIQKTSEDNEVDNIWFKVESSLGYKANIVTDSTGFTTEIDDLPIYVPATDNNELVTYKVTELGYNNGDGTYTLPSKYVTPKMQTVTLETDGSVKAVHINNKLKRGAVQLNKKDGNGQALSNVEFKLYTSDGKDVLLVQTGTSNYKQSNTGTAKALITTSSGIKVSNLLPGDYYFTETKTVSGYMPYTEKIPFTIKEGDTSTVVVEDVNYKIMTFNTGGKGSDSFYFIGIFGLLCSIVVICLNLKNNKIQIKRKKR